MPKATSQTFTAARPHAASQRPSSSAAGGAAKNGESSTGGGKNHLFNTDRFGQHILTNPTVAQG